MGEGTTPPTIPPTGPDPKPPVTANTTDLDLSKISDDQFAKVFDDPRLFKHDRFKQLAQAKQERDELKAAQTKAEDDKLKANQEFEKLAGKKTQEAAAAIERANTAEINAEIVRIAAEQGAKNLNNIKKLIDRGTIKIDETGAVTGAKEAVEALKTDSPELFGTGNTPDIGRGTNPEGANNTVKRFKLSQLNDAKFYRENYKDIQAAMRAGAIDPNS